MVLPAGVHVSGLARQLVENVNLPGRPAKSCAGTRAVEDRIDELARSGGARRIQRTLGELDVIASSFDPRAIAAVRAPLTAVLGTVTQKVVSERLQARIAGEP